MKCEFTTLATEIRNQNSTSWKFSKMDGESTMATSLEVTEEDIKICETVQKNLEGGLYTVGKLSPKHEQGVSYFQSLVRDALSAG